MSTSKIKKVLVTGGAGFVGLHAIDALLKRGTRVRVIDNFMASRRENLLPYRKQIEVIEGDIRNPSAVRRAVRGVDAVFHFAAIRSVAKTVEDPFLAHEVNATGTLLLLDAAHRAGVKHFIFTSTSAVYGASSMRLQKERGELIPISPYGIAKLTSEKYAAYYFLEKKLPTTCLRIFNVYGPRQNPESKYSLVIPGVLAKILRGQSPVIDGDGRQSRDFIYIGDVLEAVFKVLGNPKSFGKIYNLGSGQTVSIHRLVTSLLKLCGSGLRPVRGPRRPGDPDVTRADISKIFKELGWKPTVTLEQGLRETIAWAKKENSVF